MCSSDLLWGKSFPQSQEFGDGILKSLKNWAKEVRPAQGLTLRDFIDQSDQGEVKALSRLLKSMVLAEEPSPEDEFFVTKKRYFNFDKNILHTKAGLEDDGQDISRVNLKQLMTARTKGWGDRQDDRDDLYLVRDFLFGLQKVIEIRSDKPNAMLKRIRSKIHSIVDKAFRAHSRTNDGSDIGGILGRWKYLKEADSSSILTEFPWKMIADNDPGLGRLRPAFQWGNSIITYLLLSYTRLYSVELIFWFSQNPKMQEELVSLTQLEGEVNLLEAERKLPQKSSSLWVQDLVDAAKEDTAFRGIAKRVFRAYFNLVTKPRPLRAELDFLLKRVSDVLALEEVQEAKNTIGQEKVEKNIDEFLNEPSLEETFSNLARVQSV